MAEWKEIDLALTFKVAIAKFVETAKREIGNVT